MLENQHMFYNRGAWIFRRYNIMENRLGDFLAAIQKFEDTTSL